MHAIGIHRQGDIDAVVHQKQGSMTTTKLAKRLSLRQPFRIGDRLTISAQTALLGAVLHQAYTALKRRFHHGLELRTWTGDQIKPAALQLSPALIALRAGPQQLHFQVVEGVADRGRFSSQDWILSAAEFLQHPQRLLHPAAIGRHHRRGLLPLGLGRMGHACRHIASCVPRLLVAIGMQQPQPLAQIFQPRHQIGTIQPKAAPVLHHPKALPGAIEVGVEQAQHRLGLCGGRHEQN